MTPEQARAAHLAYDRLGRYLNSDADADVPSDEELEQLTYGNLLAAETGSFSLVVAAVLEIATETQTNADQLIGVFKDAAAAQELR